MKKVRQSALIGALVGLLSGPWSSLTFGAASGNYTDLLPIGAASDTTVISRGSGWALATLPTSQTFGDALSRLSYTAYQSTGIATISNTTTVSTFTALSGLGYVGSTTFPASWVATGRSIRISVRGRYTTANPGPSWTWAVKLGTTTVLSTGSQAAPGGQTDKWFSANTLLTVNATGGAGTVSAVSDILVSSGTTVVAFSTTTQTATSVDLTSQLTVNPTLTFSATGSSIQGDNIIVEFLN